MRAATGVLFVAITVASALGAQDSIAVVRTAPATPDITIIIDDAVFGATPKGDTARGDILRALALRDEDPTQWLAYKAARNEDVLILIDSVYGYNSNHPYTRQVIRELLHWANGDLGEVVTIGRVLRLPVIPRRATSIAFVSGEQLL